MAVEALELRLLGGFELRRAGGESLVLKSRKAAALVAYLAHQPGRAQSREKLSRLLWEESPESQARSSLRQVLFAIRRLLPGRPLIIEPRLDWLALDDSLLSIDTAMLETAVASGDAAALEAAVRLVHGEFLEGIAVRSEAFESWLMAERQRMRSAAMEAMQLLLELKRPAPRDEQMSIALKALTLDPAQESVHRVLMRLYAESGRRAEAIRQYFRCRDTLWREFAVRPEPATDRLYKAVLARAWA